MALRRVALVMKRQDPRPAISSKGQALVAWYDGHCGICRQMRAWLERRDRSRSIRFVDVHSVEPSLLPRARDEMMASLWAELPDGRPISGFAAVRVLMEQIPFWHWPARAARHPPLSWLGPPAYRLLARLRYRISSVTSRSGSCEGSQCARLPAPSSVAAADDERRQIKTGR